jgi:hypothetical protein
LLKTVWKKLKALVAESARALGLTFALCGMAAVVMEQSLTGTAFPKALKVGALILAALGVWKLLFPHAQKTDEHAGSVAGLLSDTGAKAFFFGAVVLFGIALLFGTG